MFLKNNYREFEELGLGKIRVMNKGGKNGFPQFVLKDVCDVLGIERNNAMKTLKTNGLDAYIDKTIIYNPLKRTGSKRIEMVVVEEPAIYRLVFVSRKPNAKKFRFWLLEKVIPAVVTIGAYVMEGERENMKKPGKVEALSKFLNEKEKVFEDIKSKLEYVEERKDDLEDSSDSYEMKMDGLIERLKDKGLSDKEIEEI